MQSFVDSLCQCFGTTGAKPGKGRGSTPLETLGSSAHGHEKYQPAATGPERVSEIPQQQHRTPSSPDGKRRTRSLALKGKQWDGLFTGDEQKQQQQQVKHRRVSSLDQAQALAKAKLTAKQQQSRNHKRKRASSRDDIFRSKQDPATVDRNPFSRFLSNNPALSNVLCFANPIRDSGDLMCDAGSVVSDSNTLNTAEDTITSTLYYEKTKLAGLKQKNPPVPLFNCFAVEPKDDIHKIVLTHSHSSVKLLDMYGSSSNNNNRGSSNGVILEEEIVAATATTPPITPAQPLPESSSPPPPIANVSSHSDSSKSNSSRGQAKTRRK